MNIDTVSEPVASLPVRRGRRRRSDRPGAMPTSAPQVRSIPAYDLLGERALAAIESQADWILEKVGVEFRGDAVARDLLREAGAMVDGDRVRFEVGHARALCATAPRQFALHARDPRRTVTLGGDHIVLMPGYGSPFVTDLDRGRRYASLEDFRNFVRLSYMAPALHHSGGTVCEPVDIPVNKRHLDMVYAHLRLSSKPFMGSVTTPSRAADSIEMARIVFGRDFVEANAVLQGNINVNSPLVFDETMSGSLRVYAEANQCVCISPAIFGGAMGPVTPAAVAAQTLAEATAGIALVQAIRPGCPVVFGSFHSTMDLRTGALTFGTPEAGLVTMALSQLGRRLGVPVRSGGGQITSANAPDGQAMRDSANALWSTMISGAHQVWHAAGWLEGGLTMSYEKFIMDVDNCGAMLRLLEGMAVDDDAFAREAYDEAAPGDNFLATAHTLRHCTTANYSPILPSPGPYETWRERGGKSAEQHANSIWKSMLASYEPPELDAQIDETLKQFMAERKSAMPDEWY
ncbi:trimethylamine methyltransferase family protein [Hoeflea sp. E7-10]|uniref:Methyltransferase n=1 Tax=Hoeflea poritis TaxID=2993659 RepID=A0ABT4VTD8_9HYPH|nr:trimethylamine methyltransferase family protein [Hoeflea poritis]MDA4847977.1 trimethylamine methyltransferase family protein [Hoeflea poritis]